MLHESPHLDFDQQLGHILQAATDSERHAALCRLPWRQLADPQLASLASALRPWEQQLADSFPVLRAYWASEEPAQLSNSLIERLRRAASQTTPAQAPPPLPFPSPQAFELSLAAADSATEYANIAIWHEQEGYIVPPRKIRIVALPSLLAAEIAAHERSQCQISASFEWDATLPESVDVAGIFVVEYGEDPQNRRTLYRTEVEKVRHGSNLDFSFQLKGLTLPRLKGYYLYVPPAAVSVQEMTVQPG